eukprot:CAMPEP_0115357852 /NCGR_PEP_ID=MMETSP0270-20121206/100357_1 /TAXON_ID=71861 /ORGANISM="Scrippsiella trochoidea, Strain CCMP3099" /LENGTH=33 /DNA_ID= /DNA_START= /DNA_END= /DNA_ORIENTATION=
MKILANSAADTARAQSPASRLQAIASRRSSIVG